MMKRTIMTASVISALLLNGCGVEAPETPAVAPPAAEGLWTGSLVFVPAKPASLLMLNTGSLWLVYEKPDGSGVGGVIQSNSGAPNDSTYTATAAREFNLEGTLGPNNISIVSTALVAGSKFWGNLSYPASPLVVHAFQTSYNSNNNSARPTILGAFAGTTGKNAGLTTNSIEAISSLSVNTTVSTLPNIIGATTSGCTVSGSISPLDNTKAYLVRLTFAGSAGACSNPTGAAGEVAGVAFIDANNKLNVLALNNARSNGFVFRQN